MSTQATGKPDRLARSWIAGFLLIGLLLGLAGSLLVAWHYHIDADPRLIALHFLGLNAGYVIAALGAERLIERTGARPLALASCVLAAATLAGLSFLAPPFTAGWRILDLACVGAAAGALMTALLHVLQPDFERTPAAAVHLSGVLFGCGCLLATVVVALAYLTSSPEIQTGLLAVVPLVFAALFVASPRPSAVRRSRSNDTLRDLRSIAAVLFSLLLFVQCGNEWAIAGWLPLYLIHRLGSNPAWAIFALAGYFSALTLGRIAVRALLPRMSHPKLLFISTAVAMTGYLLLSFTTALSGAWIAVIVIGAGFAPIFPLIAETLDERFSYHPGFYNGLFSIAITGAMCTPWLLGYLDAYFGAAYVILIPALGSIAVLVLALLIMLEARVMGLKITAVDSSRPSSQSSATAAGRS
ncbi:MAG: MFS transporter [Acidobacteriaceae bacterium]|nr:MFS transporter [Acidobacteriaceae bacterium]